MRRRRRAYDCFGANGDPRLVVECDNSYPGNWWNTQIGCPCGFVWRLVTPCDRELDEIQEEECPRCGAMHGNVEWAEINTENQSR